LFSQQESKTSIGFLARSYGDSIVLRWVPEKQVIWEHAKKKGYVISKCLYNDEAESDLSKLPFKPITNTSITFWSLTKLAQLQPLIGNTISESESNLILLAYSLNSNHQVFKGSENIFSEDLKSLKDAKTKEQQKFILALLPCEQSRLAAEASGLRITDYDVIPGKRYIYKIELAEKHPDFTIDPSYITITAHPFDPNQSLSKVFVREGHEELALSWQDIPYISSYHVDKSLDSIKYTRMTRLPIGSVGIPNYQGIEYTAYSEDSLNIGKKYYYKIYANTPFADQILIGAASGVPKDLRPPLQPFIDSVVHDGYKKVMLYWSIDKYKSEKIKGFQIGRASSDSTAYLMIHEGIIPANRTSFQDIYFDTTVTNYYKLSAIDSVGNISYSNSSLLVLKDETPPAPPIPIKGVMDSLGIVTIRLKKQFENDLMGYKVYKANADYHEFSVVKETWSDSLILNPKDTILIDTSTIESLTKFIYYKITALDYHHNESFFSEVIKVPRPDKYPPVPPLINDYNVFDDKIIFGITVRSSEDAVQNYILRKKENEVSWTIIDSVGIRDTIYTDYGPENSVAYQYAAQAKDDSGLISKMGNVVRLQTYYKPRPLDMDISCTYFPKNNMVLATWVYKEIVGNDLAVALYNPVDKPNDFKGIIRNSIQTTYAFNSQALPGTIKIKAQTSKREYLPTISNTCIINQSDINENEIYKKYKGIR